MNTQSMIKIFKPCITKTLDVKIIEIPKIPSCIKLYIKQQNTNRIIREHFKKQPCSILMFQESNNFLDDRRNLFS